MSTGPIEGWSMDLSTMRSPMDARIGATAGQTAVRYWRWPRVCLVVRSGTPRPYPHGGAEAQSITVDHGTAFMSLALEYWAVCRGA